MSQTKVEAPLEEGGGGTPFKNKFINGDFQVHQRFDGSAVTASTGYQSFDRWKTVAANTSAAWTIEKETLSAADLATTGHKQAMEIKCTTADTSTGAAEYNVMFYAVEANTLQDLDYGTSAAKSFTVSFWVRSYQTGTFVLGLAKEDGTTYYNRIEYTINASNTWEHKTLVFSPTAGDTSLITGANGYINNDNGNGIGFYFVLNAGSNFQVANNVWNTGGISTSNQTNLFSSTDNHWSITGVQMEVGDQKTDFEYLPHDIQFQRCQRYYHKIGPAANEAAHGGTGDYDPYGIGSCASTLVAQIHYQYPVRMRTDPTLETEGTGSKYTIYEAGALHPCDSVPSKSNGNNFKTRINFNRGSSAGLVAGNAAECLANAAASGGGEDTFLGFNAEL